MSVVRRCLLGILCATACAAALLAARPAAAFEIGVADKSPSAFAHPLFQWAGFRTARVVVPWDAGHRPPPLLAEWLEAARISGIEPLVTFDHEGGVNCRLVRCHLPTPSEMRAALAAFRARWPFVRTFSTWNEANHPGQPTAGRPEAAARLYEAIVAECPGCTVVAIEVLDIDGMESWLHSFRQSLSTSPRLWGLHNYGDVTRNRTTMTDRMMAAVPGEVWVTETGGIVRHIDRDGSVRWPYDEERARASVARALALGDRHAGRIGRMYFYQWRAAPTDLWDSGLMRPDGWPRPSFAEIARRMRPDVPPVTLQPAPAAAEAPSAGAGRGTVVVDTAHGDGAKAQLVFLDAAGVEVLRLLRPPSIGRKGLVRARVSCPRSSASACRARLAVRTRAITLRTGRKRAGRLLGKSSRAVAPGGKRTLAVQLRRSERRRIKRGRLRVVVATVAVPGGPRWQVSLRTRR
jgi:Glycosyl hydrolase catalytic core